MLARGVCKSKRSPHSSIRSVVNGMTPTYSETKFASRQYFAPQTSAQSVDKIARRCYLDSKGYRNVDGEWRKGSGVVPHVAMTHVDAVLRTPAQP